MTKLDVRNGQLNYSKFGAGPKILIAFHGFGQDNSIFKEWGNILGQDYTIYALDIFYHGNSHRTYGLLTKDEWREYLFAFIDHVGVDRFSVLGFSLGGRFAIATALSVPNKINELILIAPDGIFLTVWFKLATYSGIRWVFKYYMMNPDKMERLLLLNDRYKLFSPYLRDFVKKELGDENNRKRVYISWNHFKTLGFTKNQLSSNFKSHSFKRRIILGSKDQIIKPEKILPIIHTMGDFTIDILPKKHHQLIKPDVAKLILHSNQVS